MKQLEQVLGELEAAVGLEASVGPPALERWATSIRAALKDEESKWLSEDRAVRRSGKSVEWLRSRRQRWAVDGYARRVAGKWQYHEAAVPRRVAAEPADDPREQARRDAST